VSWLWTISPSLVNEARAPAVNGSRAMHVSPRELLRSASPTQCCRAPPCSNGSGTGERSADR
jgi:hypothetical protein